MRLSIVEDTWPDLINAPMILLKSDMDSLPKNFSVGQRSNDRLLNMSFMGSNLKGTRALFNYLRPNASLESLGRIIYGGTFAKQIYAKGLILHSAHEPKIPSVSLADLKTLWEKGSVSIAYSPQKIQMEVVEALKSAICAKLPFDCKFHETDSSDFLGLSKSGKYDFYFGSVGVDSINLDGGMSFYFELDPPMISSDESMKGNFVARLKRARHSSGSDQITQFRDMLVDAVEEGYILPLVHYSTTSIGRPKVDFSQVPAVFETAPFHFIRIRDRNPQSVPRLF